MKNNRRFLLVVASLFFVAGREPASIARLSQQTAGSPELPTPASASCEQRLDALDFSVSELFAGPPARPQLDRVATAHEWRFRTTIRRAAPQGPNFAGHYTVVSWGCGTECQKYAVLDAKTGRFVQFKYESSMGARFTLNSRLLVINPGENALVLEGPSLLDMLRHFSLFERVYLEMMNGVFRELCRENAASAFDP